MPSPRRSAHSTGSPIGVDDSLKLHDVSSEGAEPSPADADGTLTTTLVIDASPAYATDGVGLWVSALSGGEVIESVSLADAAIETGPGTTVVVPSGGDLTVQIEDVARTELDRTTLEIPPAPVEGGPHELVVNIDRGSLTGLPATAEGDPAIGTGDLSAVEIEPERLDLSWREGESARATPVSQSVGLVLLTENPIPLETGARRWTDDLPRSIARRCLCSGHHCDRHRWVAPGIPFRGKLSRQVPAPANIHPIRQHRVRTDPMAR